MRYQAIPRPPRWMHAGPALVVAVAAIAGVCSAHGSDRPKQAPQPAPEAAREQTRPQDYGVDTLRTEHFRLSHDGSSRWAAEAGALLEATRSRFVREMARIGLDVENPDAPLDWIVFDRRDAYEHYARRADRVDMSSSRGYYSARTNVVALLRDPAPAPGWIMAPAHDDQNPQVHAAADDATEAAAIHPSCSPHEMARISHEAIHQLAFNTGVQKRWVVYPLWVSEGMATTFEAYNGEPSGLDRHNAKWAGRIIRMRQADRLEPLEQVLLRIRPPRQPRALNDAYASSWAAFSFLASQRPRQLAAYLATLREARTGRRPHARMRRELEQAFGPIDALEPAWRQFIEDLTLRPSEPAATDPAVGAGA